MTKDMTLSELRPIWDRIVGQINPLDENRERQVIYTGHDLEVLMLDYAGPEFEKQTRTLIDHGFGARIHREAVNDLKDRRRSGIYAVGMGWIEPRPGKKLPRGLRTVRRGRRRRTPRR